MKQTNINEIVKKLIAKKAGIDPSEVTETMYLGDDLNLGDMEITEILEELEEIFKVDLINHEQEIESVEDIINILSDNIE